MLVDARHANDIAVGVIGQRQTQVEDDVVVDVLDVEIDRAALERAAHSEAQLSALVRCVTGVADAVVLAVEAADADAPIADWRREPAVEAPQAVVAGLELDVAFALVAGLACNEVHCAAGRVRRKHRSRPAAHDFDALDRIVEAKRLVRIQPAESGIVLDRQSILQQADCAEPFLRNAAHADVRTRLAAGGFDPEARHGAERVGDAEWRVHAQRIAVDRRDRVAHFHFANVFDTSAARDDHSFDVIRRLLLGMQRRCSGHREHSSDGPTDERAA